MFMGSGNAIHLGEHTFSAVNAPAAGSGWWRQLSGAVALLSLGGLTRSGRQLARTERLLEDETRLRRELSAYLTIDWCPEQLSQQEFARLLCRTVATRSCFPRAALLLSDGAGALSVVGSAGLDDVTVKSLNRWGSDFAAEAMGGRFLLHLERQSAPVSGRRNERTTSCANLHVIPMRSAKGVLGVLVVSSEPRPSVRGALTTERLQRLMEPMETLCAQLSLQLARRGEAAAPELRRREHVVRAQADRSGQRRAMRRRGVDRSGAPMLGVLEQATAQQIASIAAAVRSGKAALQLPAELPTVTGDSVLPMVHRSVPRFPPHGTSTAPGTA